MPYLKSIILLFLILLNVCGAKAQTYTDLQASIPDVYSSQIKQSPSAYSLGKFGAYPVSQYTGLPNINIPLYSVTAGGFEMPIGISYHGGGIKVSEEAGPVGLGWALQAGGMITHVVKDRNDLGVAGDHGFANSKRIAPHLVIGDENASYYNYLAFQACRVLDYTTVGLAHPIENGLVYYSYKDANGDWQTGSYREYIFYCDSTLVDNVVFYAEYYDTEPDLFYFSCGPYSGKFIYSRESGQFESIDRSQQFKFEYLSENEGWKIITSDGTIFSFAEKEEYHSENGTSSGGAQGPKHNNYHLTKVNTYKGDEITLTYNEGNRICQLPGFSESYSYYVLLSGGNNVGYFPSLTGYRESFSQTSYLPSYLDDIVFPGGRLKFNWNSRQDILNDQRLESIQLFNTINPTTPVKTVSFDNDQYFNGQSTTGFDDSVWRPFGIYCGGVSVPDYTNDQLLKRLKLEGIRMTGQDKPYKFEYNEAIMLPSKMSYAQDYWGYYNGNNTATTFIMDPFKYDYNFSSMDFPYDGLSKMQDRRANSNANACILTKIIYPTGGSTYFEFEPNTFSNYDIPSHYDIIGDQAHAEYTLPASIGVNPINETFTIDQEQEVRVRAYVPADEAMNPYGSFNTTTNIWLRIINNSDNSVVWQDKFLEYSSSNYSCSEPEENHFITLSPGSYTVEVDLDETLIKLCNDPNPEQVYLDVYYRKKLLLPGNATQDYSTGAGLRIKRMIDDDGFGNTIEKTYSYHYGSAVVQSYGELMDKPRFYRESPFNLCVPGLGTTECESEGVYSRKQLLSSPLGGLSTSIQGNFVGYKTIKETLTSSSGNIGHIRYNYFSDAHNCNSMSISPCRVNPFNGRLMDKVTKDKDGTELYIEEYAYNTYDMDDALREDGMAVEPASAGGYGFHQYLLHFYPIVSSRVDLDVKTLKTKDIISGNWLTTITEYDYYDNGFLKEEIFTDSDGDELITSYDYPQQLSSVNTVYAAMESANAIHIPIQKKVKKDDGVTISSLYEQVNNYGQMGMDILLTHVENSFDGNILETVVEVIEYDSYNNPIEVVNRSGIHESMQYGHEGSLLLAQVTNAKHDQFFYEGFESASYLLSEARAGFGYYNGSSFNIGWTPPDSEDYIIEYWQRNASSEWEYHTASYTGPMNLTGPVDEIRIYPADAEMTTYTYDPLVGLTSINDARGYIQYYEYDDQKRLQHNYDEDGNILTRYEYRYKN